MSRTTLPVRRLGALAVLLGLVITVLLPVGAANAVAYRYWGYYQLSGSTWEFATKGPAETNPADGSVEGWRFAVGDESSTRLPRAVATFDEICGGTAAEDDEKRVAVVIDYGRAADSEDGAEPPAPTAACALVPSSASGLDVLLEVADVRQDASLICAIDDYPATGCGGEVKTVSEEAAAPDTAVELDFAGEDAATDVPAAEDEDESNTGTYVAIAVILVAALGVGLAVSRRRGSA